MIYCLLQPTCAAGARQLITYHLTCVEEAPNYQMCKEWSPRHHEHETTTNEGSYRYDLQDYDGIQVSREKQCLNTDLVSKKGKVS
jgi:hypothetical protein